MLNEMLFNLLELTRQVILQNLELARYFVNNFPESLSIKSLVLSFVLRIDAGTTVVIGPSTTFLIACALRAVGTIIIVNNPFKQAGMVMV